jgi:methylmalonyl-CoA mutase C-terminal domain/subunit
MVTPTDSIHTGIVRPRVLMTKIGFDGHDRGSRLVARFLRDAGMEVIYTGPWQPVESVVSMALQEDVDVIGISSLAADHLLIPKLMSALTQAGLDDVLVVVGGVVPDPEVPLLLDAGVAEVFHPGSTRDQIVTRILALLAERRTPASTETP